MLYQLLECEKREIQKQFNGMFAVIISRFDGLYKRNKPKGRLPLEGKLSGLPD